MGQHLIFLVHGMGQHAEGWSIPAQKVLKDAYSSPTFERLADVPFDESFFFHEITYDQQFEKVRKRWDEESTAVIEHLNTTGVDAGVIETIARLGGSGAGSGFLKTHVLDVLFYRFFPTVRDPVRMEVAKAITAALAEARVRRGVVQWSVIAHSLGTAVVHDTLHLMFGQPQDPDFPRLSVGNNSPHAYLACANVSRVLSKGTGNNVYESRVRPALRPSEGAVLSYFLNAWNLYDPIPRVSRFEPDHLWLDAGTAASAHPRFQDIEISEVREPNVHGFEHYLENPAVHVPLFRALRHTNAVVRKAEYEDAITAYRKRVVTARTQSVRDELRNLVERRGSGIKGLIESMIVYRDIVLGGRS